MANLYHPYEEYFIVRKCMNTDWNNTFTTLSTFAHDSKPWHRSGSTRISCAVNLIICLCFARWFWPDPMNVKNSHATAVCISEIFALSNCLLDHGTDILIGNIVFVWDLSVAPHSCLELCCERWWMWHASASVYLELGKRNTRRSALPILLPY